MTYDEQQKELKRLKDAINSAVLEAEVFADKHKLTFYISGPAYGMGGTYDHETGEWSASSENS
ncbi:hypothetical protein ZZ1p0083 [Acinetobacter phage ZZ1]|uniref:Uncharacterized protein n=2 Tax=Caudoviricetes TaxID=2731619 RepID=I3WVK7_9CAUD|nr:hypothetical protein ZZ1p0083 [Acinetobacter phage ZZ1]AFL47527.1 hypothetical protein ZZ1p0083 [Acinetobacter phage ZZ1]